MVPVCTLWCRISLLSASVVFERVKPPTPWLEHILDDLTATIGQPAASTVEETTMSKTVAILDGYTVEPSGLGVPPYLSTYVRGAYSALHNAYPSADVRYLSIDDVRWCLNGGVPSVAPPRLCRGARRAIAPTVTRTTPLVRCSSSQLIGVLNNVLRTAFSSGIALAR